MSCHRCQKWNHREGKRGLCKNTESKQYGKTMKRHDVCDKFKAVTQSKHEKGTYLRHLQWKKAHELR